VRRQVADLVEERRHRADELEHLVEPLTRVRLGSGALLQRLGALTQDGEGGIDLAALALFRDVQDHFLYIFPRLEMIATIAEYVN